MAVTHHCKNKTTAKAYCKKARKNGLNCSMSKTKKGWSVSVWK